MFFYLSKLLTFLLLPITWLFALLIYLLLSKNEKRKRKAFLTFCAGFYILCNSFLSTEFMRAWEVPAVADETLSTYDAGIVLSGMMTYDTKLKKNQFMHGADRLLQAIQLYKKGKIKKIVFTGGSGSLTYPDMKEGIYIREFLLQLGIPQADFFIESESHNTRENATFTKPLLDKEFPQGKFLLITSAYHMRRSLGCFRKAGITVTPYSTDRLAGERKLALDFYLIPNIDALDVWQAAIHEMSGYMIYKLAGYI
ncbi:MAG: YdcF family protein [Bacteroidia bacterium]